MPAMRTAESQQPKADAAAPKTEVDEQRQERQSAHTKGRETAFGQGKRKTFQKAPPSFKPGGAFSCPVKATHPLSTSPGETGPPVETESLPRNLNPHQLARLRESMLAWHERRSRTAVVPVELRRWHRRAARSLRDRLRASSDADETRQTTPARAWSWTELCRRFGGSL